MRDVNSLNKVLLIGRLGGKPELRVLPQKDRSVAHFTLATNERSYNPNTNQSTDRTEWHKIVAWGKLAEFCERYLNQGKQVLVEGKLRTRNWQDRDGNKRTTTEIEAFSIVLLGKREEGTSAESFAAEPATQDFPAEAETEFPAPGGEGEDEVPF